MNKIFHRILTLGLGLGILGVSAVARADHPEPKIRPYGWFSPHDTNRDGVVTLAEYQQFELTEKMAEFDRADCNDNGVVSLNEARNSGVAEFVQWANENDRVDHRYGYRRYVRVRWPRQPVLTRSMVKARSYEASRIAFEKADLDRDGVIERRELAGIDGRGFPYRPAIQLSRYW